MKIHLKKLCTALSKIKAATTAFLLLLGCLAVPKPTFAGTYTELFNFTGGTGAFSGASPASALLLSGTTLYGTASEGGATGDGVVFSYNTATGAYTELFNFTGMAGSFIGAFPFARVLLLGTTLYGTTENGGTSSLGVLFSYNTATSTYTDLVNFTGTTGAFPGANPQAGVILAADGVTLYGTAAGGGTTGDGVVFSYDTATSTYSELFNFTGAAGAFPGNFPQAGVILSGTTLYGTTEAGGVSGNGVVFSYNTATSTYTELFNFTGTTGAFPGAQPQGDLILSGTTLYGTATAGGATNQGVVFSYNTATSTYTELFNFTASAGPFFGAGPTAGVILSGTTLYGTASGAGVNGNGVVFSYDTATSTYTDLVDFTGGGGSFPGANPYGGVILSGTALYGTAEFGGTNNNGVVFTYNLAPQGGYAGKKKKKGPRPSHHPSPAPTRTPKYKHK